MFQICLNLNLPLLFISDWRFEPWVFSSYFSLGPFNVLRLYSADKTYSWVSTRQEKDLKHYKMLWDRSARQPLPLVPYLKANPISSLLEYWIWTSSSHVWIFPLLYFHTRLLELPKSKKVSTIRQTHWCAPAVPSRWWCIVCHCVMTELTWRSGDCCATWFELDVTLAQSIAIINLMASYWPAWNRSTNSLWRGLWDPGGYTDTFSSSDQYAADKLCSFCLFGQYEPASSTEAAVAFAPSLLLLMGL